MTVRAAEHRKALSSAENSRISGYAMSQSMPAARIYSRTIICAFLVLFTTLAHAHDSEPINTDFATPLTRGTANLNFDLQKFRHSTDEDIAGLDFEYGLARRMQFTLAMPLSRHVNAPGESVIGAGNLEFQYRYLLAGGNERPFAVSINPEAEFPTGNPGVTDRAYSLGAAIHFDAHHGDKLWLHSNWGYSTSVSNFDEKAKDFRFAVAGMYELTERLHSVLEIFGDHEFRSSVTQTFFAPELIYSVAEHWEIKAAVPFGATSSTPTLGAQIRVTWKIGRSEHQ